MDKSSIRQYIEHQKKFGKLSHKSVSGKTLQLSNASFQKRKKPLSERSKRHTGTVTVNDEWDVNDEWEELLYASKFVAET